MSMHVRRRGRPLAAAAMVLCLALAPRPEAAEPTEERAPPAPPAGSAPPREEDADREAARDAEQAPGPAPGERVSADNNISFPVDI